ncbi:hypothetical protein CEUSTIGMA_g11627.t1 [Chlamydomonas eustigma]|uniref:GAF domain-containing protein n=1 Tax=Chlamydomonas eustigma TaxID=1157962 RepID=A0A250XM94_9CHLO|nr:hypothetical protein CEUSTIGMA_g11627.t1 [Chlamydomonas eustigma]|eukprot:GAX84204.1 hypothetical protein CEUSTIGMA_g11627.t1 [Chlamydomonas eustigma]
MSDIDSIRVFPDVEQIVAAAVESVMDDLQSHEEERAAMLDNVAARGLAYQAFALGCPRPPREEERVKTLEALCHNYDINVDNAELDSILLVLNHVFNAPISMVVLFKGAIPNSSPGNNLVYVKEGMGVDYLWRWSFCGWSMWTSPNPQIMVIPDAQQDARFCDNPYVKEPDGWLRFYCGAPLIASNGHHLGTLCFIDTSPCLLSASQCALVNNMTEMVVRHTDAAAEELTGSQVHDLNGGSSHGEGTDAAAEELTNTGA